MLDFLRFGLRAIVVRFFKWGVCREVKTMAKFKFISPIPCTFVNSIKTAGSTLDVVDNWGRFEEGIGEVPERGFALCRVKDPVTHEVVLDDDGSDALEVRVIGPAHVKWDRYFVLVRLDEANARWAEHLPVALNMLYENRHCGESHPIGDEDLGWVRSEGERWVREGKIFFRNSQGRLTRPGKVLLELGVVTQLEGGVFKVTSDLSAEEREHVRLVVEARALAKRA